MTGPVIFLDIDGVLNSERTCLAFDGYPWAPMPDTGYEECNWHKFDDVAIGLLRRVVAKTGAVCVLSSSWRVGLGDDDLNALATRLGVPIIGCTRPTLAREKRGEQIRDWLAENPLVTAYAILDDDADMLEEQKPYFVQTCHRNGFTIENYMRLFEILI